MSARTKKIEDKVRDIVLEVIQDGLQIYHIEYLKEFGTYYLRVYIDKLSKDEYVSVEDCEILSRNMNEKMDAMEKELADNYILEVCSPGVDRALHADKHYEDAIGEEIVVKTLVKVEGSKEHIAVLQSFDDKVINLKDDDKTYSIEREKITKANIYFA